MRGDGGLWYSRRGIGAKLLLVQGTAGTHLHWGERLLSLLAASFDVVAFDHRGVGRSAPAYDSFTLPDLADDAVGLLDEIGWERAHILGVSMGGVVAQELALRHPDRVDSLVLGCTSTGGAGASPIAVSRMLAPAIIRGDAQATLRNLYCLGVKDPGAARPGAWEEYRNAGLTLPVDARITTLQIGAVARHSTADRLSSIAVPTHVVHGDTDRFVHISAGRQVAAAIRHARFTALSAGHFFWLEQPERTAELISELALHTKPVCEEGPC